MLLDVAEIEQFSACRAFALGGDALVADNDGLVVLQVELGCQ